MPIQLRLRGCWAEEQGSLVGPKKPKARDSHAKVYSVNNQSYKNCAGIFPPMAIKLMLVSTCNCPIMSSY